ncbi:MAG: T9SS type A sorting domain-containing protein, partial [Bacteroidota bacterium]|nr:T9SS type A sorting domain-containing protein [Bacteroidota bacterium]
ALALITANDVCDGAITPTCSAGTISSTGCWRYQTFTLTAKDSCTNSATCNVNYKWKVDLTPPVITGCPSDTTYLGCNPTPPTCADALALVTVNDECDGAITPTCSAGEIISDGNFRIQTFTLTAIDSCNNPSQCQVTYSWRIFECSLITYVVNFINNHQYPVWCPMINNTLVATIPPLPDVTSVTNINWTIEQPSSWTITSGNGTLSIKFKTDCADMSATFDLSFRVHYSNGSFCDITCQKVVTSVPAYEDCALTMGGWGQPGGRLCGQLQHDILVQLLTPTGITLGASGHSYYTTDGAAGANCVEEVLPSGGPAAALNTSYICYSPNKNLVKNILLGQSLTLAINMRNAPYLWGVVLSPNILVANKSGDCNSPADANTFSYVHISQQNVINYLNANYGGATVGTLIELANDALGDVYIPSQGTPSFSEISGAEDAINSGFDECKYAEGAQNPSINMPRITNITSDEVIQLKAYPNPFDENLTIEVRTNQKVSGTIDIYNMMGIKVAHITRSTFEKNTLYTFQWQPGPSLQMGLYLINVVSNSGSKQLRIELIK